MGATEFMIGATEAKVELAFRRAQERARHSYGHDGYTGTIAEKSTFIVIECRGSDKDKAHYAQSLIDNQDPRIDDKWGPAGAIKMKKGWLFFGIASE